MNLTQFAAILRARLWVVLVALAAALLAALGTRLLLPERYVAGATLLIEQQGIDPISGLILPAQFYSSSYMATQAELIGSRNVALKVVDALDLTASPAARRAFHADTGGRGSLRHWLADRLLEDLTVEPSRESSLIEVRYQGTDPRYTAALANAFADAYVRTSLELRVRPAQRDAAWFEARTLGQREELARAREAFSGFQRESGIVSADERLDVETARLNEISNQLVQAQAQDIEARSKHREAQAYLRGGASGGLPEVIANPLVQNLQAELARKEARLKELDEDLGRNHPDYLGAQAEAASLRAKADRAIRATADAIASNATVAARRVSELRAALDAQKALVLGIKEQRDRLSGLEREVENAQQTYDSTMQRLGQIRLESQASQTNIAVLNPAVVPTEPSSPGLGLTLSAAGVLGLLLGLAATFLLEAADRRVRVAEDVSGLGLPLLAVLPPRRRPPLRGRAPFWPWARRVPAGRPATLGGARR